MTIFKREELIKKISQLKADGEWDKIIEEFEREALKFERDLEESGYSGQGHGSGAESFYGGYFGFGGENQLATKKLDPSIEKIRKIEDREKVYNFNSQQKINRGYPAPQSVSGFPGGESTGIRSGERIPNNISDIALSPEELSNLANRKPNKEYYGLSSVDADADVDTEERNEDDIVNNVKEMKEQAGAGWQGPQRGTASDQNYRDLPGWPRHNSIEKPGNFIPDVEGDIDGDGEEDDYLTDEEYINDVLRLNGINIKPGHMKKLFVDEKLEESSKNNINKIKIKDSLETHIIDNNSADLLQSVDDILSIKNKKKYKDLLSPDQYKWAWRFIDFKNEKDLEKILRKPIKNSNKKIRKFGKGVLYPKEVLSSWTINPRSLVYSGFLSVIPKGRHLALFKAPIRKNKFFLNPDNYGSELEIKPGYSLERETLGVGPIKYDNVVFETEITDQSLEGKAMNLINLLNPVDEIEWTEKYYFPNEYLDEGMEHKKMYGFLHERTLFHGTSNEHLDSIKKYGLTGELGDFVKDAYGMDLEEEEWENRLSGITFAADKTNIGAAVGAMRYHVGKKLNKHLAEVTEEDLKNHGMLVIIRDIDEPKKIKYPEDVEENEWYHRPEGDENYYGQCPMTVEPGDWFIKGGAGIDDVLTGNKMMQFLRRVGGLENVESDMRRKLIKMAVAHHYPQVPKKDIVNKVLSLNKNELWDRIRQYEELTKDKLLKQRQKRYGSQTKKKKIGSNEQLSLKFGESKLTLKKLFFETGASPSPSYSPEPDRGTEQYKQGYWEETPQGDDWLINHVDYSKGHASKQAAEKSPGAMTYGQIGSPKDFVPEDWEQRNPKTKETPIDMDNLKEIIEKIIKEILDEAYTGIDDQTGKDEPEGGSEAFEQSREKVFKYDEKQKPSNEDKDLKNYHMGDD